MNLKRFLIIILVITIITLSYFTYDYYAYPIPRIIHYVWVGKNPLPEEAKQVIATWERYAPNYRIHKIDETNCNVAANDFVREAYRQKAWHFVSDYCRFVHLEKEGGLYLDTDHILKDNPDKLLKGAKRVFTQERIGRLSASFIAVQPNDIIIQKLKQQYDTFTFDYEHFRYHGTSPEILTNTFVSLFGEKHNGLFYENKGTRILPTNIAMIDLGGGENAAEHLYDGFGTEEAKGTWYLNFQEYFLQKASIHLCADNTKEYFILTTPKTGYLFGTKEKARIRSRKVNDLVLQWQKSGKKQKYRKKDECYYPITSVQ